ncbi:hypothetical protein BaRGS_00012915 [Batillaria attramentaria]|uniref:GST C-terminal domain-containing protein n=1 Tax=Batillaria attramentaria TaxID=370345 RepID=A0ABD0L9Q3_9CAEN
MAGEVELVAVAEYFQAPYGGVTFSKKDQTPSVKTKNGKMVTGQTTVAKHLSQAGKVSSGLTLEDQAAVEQWLEYRCTQVDRCGHNGIPVSQVLQELNLYLTDKVYFVTHHPTLADIFLYHGLHKIISKLTFQEKEKYVHVSRWFDNIQQDTTLRQSLQLLPFSRSSLYS